MYLNKYSAIRLNEVDSTNEYAKKYILEHTECQFVSIMAGFQTLGRGQHGNKWESNRDENIMMSLIFKPTLMPANRQFVISQATSLAIVDYLLGMSVKDVKIKWPNDIYVGNKKICGILVENFIEGSNLSTSIIGVGLNLNQKEFISDAPNPISLYGLVGIKQDVATSQDLLVEHIIKRLESISSATNTLDNEYKSNLFRLGMESGFTVDGEHFDGEILGVNEIGQLIIRTNNMDHTFSFKEVAFRI